MVIVYGETSQPVYSFPGSGHISRHASVMSDTEEKKRSTSKSIENTSPTELGEGACGGDVGLRPSTPFSDNGDNISMEVRFSEGSSHHASDLSSVSYQNLLDDEGQAGNLSRRDSEDSVDSYLPDYCDEVQREADMLASQSKGGSYSEKISDRISVPAMSADAGYLTPETGEPKKSSGSVKSDPGPDVNVNVNEVNNLQDVKTGSINAPMSVQDCFRKHELVITMRDQQRSKSLPPGEDGKEEESKKRNSLEIRNNIPVTGEVKNYEKDIHIDNVAYTSQGAKPKMKKQSPGLACRVEENERENQVASHSASHTQSHMASHSASPVLRDLPSDVPRGQKQSHTASHTQSHAASNTQSQSVSHAPSPPQSHGSGVTETIKVQNDDRPMDINAEKVISDLIQISKAHSQALSSTLKGDNNPADLKEENDLLSQTNNGYANPLANRQADIENEYEYVKYSRIQEGNSYVGMRLAYNSSESDGQDRRSVNGVDGLTDNSREATPERFANQSPSRNNVGNNNFSEDALTEIPLNGPECLTVIGDENKLFTLSPENTECDSVEIESVVSEGDNDPTGMPNVEDGLSSSQNSDTEDNVRSEHNTPKHILQKKHQQEVERQLYGVDCDTMKPKQMDAEAIIDDLKLKREALDNAISEIKTAIQKSKGIALEAPYRPEDENDPIWVKREEPPVIPKGGSTHDVINSREEQDRNVQTELRKKENELVYAMENEKERLLDNQITKNDGKVYQTPKGYDSDDECDKEDLRYTRRIKGKLYSKLPKEESCERASHVGPQYVDSDSSSHLRVDSVSMYGDSNSFTFTQDSHSDRRNSESLGSSEEFCSDSEVPTKTAYIQRKEGDYDTDEETDQLLEKQYQGNQYVDIPELTHPPVNRSAQAEKRRSRAKEVQINDPDNPSVLIEGVLFRARYLGSTQLISEGQPSKAMRMMQAQEAVGRIKLASRGVENREVQTDDTDSAPEGENQPSTEVDLFVSTEKIMVLNTDLQEIMMDHSLRTISYIADIGDILVIMARRRLMGSPGDTDSMRRRKQAKIICHVFESEEAQLIAQSIGQAFQVAYMEFLKANGIEDPGLMKEVDYQEVLNQQQIYGEELNMFANKDMQKEVIVPKLKGEQLGVVIVESGWGSMVPTVVLANMAPAGPAARCGQLNIGDQIISVNGISLVGLPLSSAQTNIKGTKHQTVVKLTVVPCPPVVEVLIKRPDVKYQLGFSVQNGVICSLLRGGIAERGGVRVGHRIIEINGQSVVAVPHEKIVALLANSVGEIHMKTMPTSIFRLLTGQETPHYL